MTLVPVVLAALTLLSPPRETRATRYADDARDEGGTPACWRRCLRAGAGGSCADRFRDAEFDAAHPIRVAHRSLPCGTVVVLSPVGDPSRIALGVVLDRGPYGVATDGRPGSRRGTSGPRRRYRGDLDLSPRVADAIGLTHRVGRLAVRWWVLKKIR